MATESSAQFFALLKKSGIYEASEIEALTQANESVSDIRVLARNLVSQGKLTEWQAKLLLSGRHKMKVGAYILQDRMPKQPIGDRFVALHRQLDRQVDVLIFPASVSENEGVFKQFLTKASSVAELNHPNLLQLYDIDQDNGRYYMVFEHEEGDSLQNIPRGNLNAEQTASIVKQSLEGIAFAHEREILHGKIDETQIRVRGKKLDKASLQNMGLASLLDQLADTSNTSDEFAVAVHPTDDISALGKIGKSLLNSHVGQALTDSDKQLVNLFTELEQATDNTPETFRRFDRDLEDWLQRRQAEMPATSEFADLPSDPMTLSNLASPKKPAPATATKPKGPKAKGGTKKVSVADGKKRLMIALGAFIGICAIGGGLYYGLGSDDKEQQAKTESSSDASSESEAIKTKTSNKKSGGLEDKGNKSAREKTGWRPPAKPSARDDANRKGAEKSSTDGTTRPPTQPANRSSTPNPDEAKTDKASVMQESTQETATTTTQASNVTFPGAEGWPLISWEDAAEYVGKEVVVYGVIQSVGGSSTIRFLNFKSRDNKAFTVIVRKSNWDISEGKLRDAYDDCKVLVKGKMDFYKPKDQPQIEVKSAEQIQLIDDLPESNGQPMVVAAGGKGGTMSSGTGSSGNSATVAPVSTGAFAKVPSTLGLIELTRNEPDYGLKTLAEVDLGENPLALELTIPEEADEKEIFFSLERDNQTRKRWEVFFAPRKRDAESKYVVGEFVLEGNSLGFKWNESPKYDGRISQLRNCLLKLLIDGESKTVLLRDPVILDPIQFTEKKAQVKQRLEVANLPRPDAISIEFLPYPEEKFEEQVADLGTHLNVDQKEIVVVFDKLMDNQFYRVVHRAEKIKEPLMIESAVELNINGPKKYSVKNLRDQEKNLMKLQADTNAENTWALEYEPPKGSIRDHNKRKKEISARLEIVNAQVAAYQVAKPKLAQVLAEKVRFRVLYTVGDIEFELAKTKE